jgi:hypothetical protein
MNDKQILVDTLSAIQMSNGLVRMMFVNQDVEEFARGVAPDQVKPQLRQCITMPLPGFIFAATVIEKFLQDPRLQEVLKQARESGALPEGFDISSLVRNTSGVSEANLKKTANG